MGAARIQLNKGIEQAVRDILQSKAESRIYLYLLRKNGAKSEDIIRGTKLHPSTVRELLSKMHERKVIHREKLKNDSIGKNPYFYRAISPMKLIQSYAREMEERLTKFANFAYKKDESQNYVKINIYRRKET